ncbi:hypothetical protein EK21DRAFT_70805, partial [Setomelanomma holmii]
LSLLLIALVGFVAGCPPPLDDLRNIGNDTHTTAHIIQTLTPQTPGSIGRNEIISHLQSGEARTIWPNGIVQYCFTNEPARINFEDDIMAAWKLWYDRFGNVGAAYGHKLQFHEYAAPDGTHPYCHLPNSENWNPEIPHNIAAFGEDDTPNVQAWSITGYMPMDFNDEPDRHGSRFNLESKKKYPHDHWITTVAHELGHLKVIGDDHVHFDCGNLRSYAKANVKVMAAGKHTMAEVCNDYGLGLQYNFHAISDFDTIDHTESKDGEDQLLIITTDLDFDDESIMLYSSAEFIRDGLDVSDVHRWVGFEPPEPWTKDDLELIAVDREVSEDDHEGVKHLWPWG